MKIFDERESFYQWDLNQKIKSELFKEGDEVHFGQSRSGKALVVKAYKLGDDIVADVPNILLQSTRKIIAFQYVKDGESEYTTNEHTFAISARPKPEDYVYTETELITVKDFVNAALIEAKESGDFKGEKGDKGDPYTLTEADKTEITNKVLENFVDVSEVGR